MCIFFFSLFFISACLFVIVFVWLGWCLPPKKRNLDLSFFLCSLNDSLCLGKQNETFNKNKVGGPNTSQWFLFKAACIHPEKQCKTNAEIGYERWPVSFPGHRLPFRFGFQVSLRSTPPSPSTYQTHSLFHTNPFFSILNYNITFENKTSLFFKAKLRLIHYRIAWIILTPSFSFARCIWCI